MAAMSDGKRESAGSQLAGKVAQAAAAGGIVGATGGPVGALAGAGVGALTTGATELVGMAVSHLATCGADRRLFEAEERLKAQDLADHQERINEKLDALIDAVGEKEAASTVVPTLQAWNKAWSLADGKKRRVIMAALVSAFDPESHDEAMAIRFFRLLEHLDYPEIQYACEIYKEFLPDKFSLSSALTGASGPGGREAHLLTQLERQGLMRYTDRSLMSPTWLGQSFVAFLRRGGFLTGLGETHELPPTP